MPSSDYYWSKHLVNGFGRMWFLTIPQEAGSSGGGKSLLGSVVNEHEGTIFGPTGIIGKDFPEPNHVTTPQIIFKAIEANRNKLDIAPGEPIVQEIKYPGLTVEVERKRTIKIGVANFPSLPVSFSIDYSRMNKIIIEFGSNTRKLFIPTAFLTRLKDLYGGDDSKVPGSAGVNIDKETIVHQLLLTDQYSIVFESTEEFKPQFEAAINTASILYTPKIKFELDKSTKKRVTVTVQTGKEYLIALKDIDWGDF